MEVYEKGRGREMKKKRKAIALLMAGVLTLGCFPVTVSAEYNAYDAPKPEDGTTKDQPFPTDLFYSLHNSTDGFTRFRIPALTTTSKGTLIAAADLRWDFCNDGSGIDTVVTRSEDDGANWSYTVANYLGDNAYKVNANSATFIDPALVTVPNKDGNGDTIIMICDLAPAGLAVTSYHAAYGMLAGNTGYDEQGHLLLAEATSTASGKTSATSRSQADFAYHLEKRENATKDAYYYIRNNTTNEIVQGYTIDDHFNIKSLDGAETTVNTNLFCGDSPYFQYPTNYLYEIKSTDDGKTWSAPTLIKAKTAEEQTYLIGPGHGLVTSTGRIIFPCYTYTNGNQISSIIYSDDNGETWTRGAAMDTAGGASSEDVAVEADGKIYLFVRSRNVYYVSSDNGDTWSSAQTMGITYNKDCELSAITYSKKINGKTAIIFSGPSDTGSRKSGRIWVALVQDDGSLKWQTDPYVVNNGTTFAYSCLTETSDGNIAILYEYDERKITFKKIDVEDIIHFCLKNESGSEVSSVKMTPGNESTFELFGIEEGETVSIESSNDDLVAVEYADGKLKLTASQSITKFAQVTLTITSGDKVIEIPVYVTADADEKYQNITLKQGESVTINDTTGDYTDTDVTDFNNENVASVALAKVQMKSSARLATAAGKFDGDKLDLKRCLFTFSSTTSGSVFGYTEGDMTVFIAPKSASDATIPCVISNDTTKPSVTITWNDDETVNIMDNATGTRGGYLTFVNQQFNRQSATADTTKFELYKQSTDASKTTVISGYEKVKSASEMTEGGRYLIVTPEDSDGNRYILNPYSEGSGYNHVAKLVNEVQDDVAVEGATSETAWGGTKKTIRDCLYTFVRTSTTSNRYDIVTKTADGTRVWLNVASAVGLPNRTSSGSIEVYDAGNGLFAFQDMKTSTGNGNYGVLYLYRDSNTNYKFDRLSATTYTALSDSYKSYCQFELYTEDDTAGEDATIPGYRKITSLSDITSGGRYLIVGVAGTERRLLSPATSDNKYEHIAKLTTEVYDDPYAKKATGITFTGVKPGMTSIEINGTTYYVTVTGEEVSQEEVGLKITAPATGALKSAEKTSDSEKYSVTSEWTKDGAAVTEVAADEKGGNYTITMTVTPGENVTFTKKSIPETIQVNVDGGTHSNSIQTVPVTSGKLNGNGTITVTYSFEDLFVGGSLRMDYGSEDYSKTSMRFGYDFELPSGAVFDGCEWYFGTAENALTHSLCPSPTKYITSPEDKGENVYRANIVFTNLPSKNYTSNVYARVLVKYTVNGKTCSKMGSYVDTRTVREIADGIQSSEKASDKEKTYADGILKEIKSE